LRLKSPSKIQKIAVIDVGVGVAFNFFALLAVNRSLAASHVFETKSPLKILKIALIKEGAAFNSLCVQHDQ